MNYYRAFSALRIAVVFPLLLAFAIATAEYGIYFFIAYETEQVAQQAARAGAIAREARTAIAGAEANRLITELGLSGYNPEVRIAFNPPGNTSVNISFQYTSVTGIAELPGLSLLFPSRVDKTATQPNF